MIKADHKTTQWEEEDGGKRRRREGGGGGRFEGSSAKDGESPSFLSLCG